MKNKDPDKNVNINLEKAKEYIKIWFNLDLRLGELFELRKIVERTTMVDIMDRKNYSKEYDKQTINPALEAMYLFMNKNYETKIEHYGHLYELDYHRVLQKITTGIDNYLDKYKLMQEEMHFP